MFLDKHSTANNAIVKEEYTMTRNAVVNKKDQIRERPLSEIKELYKNEIESLTADICAVMTARKTITTAAFIPEIVVKLGEQIAQAGRQTVAKLSDFVECAASVILEPVRTPILNYAVARATGDESKPLLVKKGTRCELVVDMAPSGKEMDVMVSLRDGQHNPINKFTVTILKAETGEKTDEDETDSGTASYTLGVGKHIITAISDDCSCSLALEIK